MPFDRLPPAYALTNCRLAPLLGLPLTRPPRDRRAATRFDASSATVTFLGGPANSPGATPIAGTPRREDHAMKQTRAPTTLAARIGLPTAPGGTAQAPQGAQPRSAAPHEVRA